MASSSMNAEGSDSDSISVRDISIPFAISAPNVWGDDKFQPALVSLELLLRSGFASAAAGDRLDSSTIHYGILTKEVRATCKDGMTFEEVLQGTFDAVQRLGRDGLTACKVKIRLPKGAMHGTAVELTERREYGISTMKELKLEFLDVRYPVLIGVNSYERTMKQPLSFDLSVHFHDESKWRDLFKLERNAIQIMEDTSYETLESLADFTAKELRSSVLDDLVPGGRLELQIAKPKAIMFADAPIIKISRSIPWQ